MSDKKCNENWDLFDLALVAGIVILALNNMDGWGWLVFILILKNG